MDWGLISVILAIIFFVSMLYLYFRQSIRKKPVWAYETKKIIGISSDLPLGLRLFYNERQISEVYKTRFLFLNRGNISIRKEDITDVITVNLKEAEVLDYVYTTNKPETRMNVSKQDSSIFEIEFLYLGKNDGIIVEILHTQYSSIVCEGNIIDGGKPRNIGEFSLYPPKKYYKLSLVGFLGFILVLILQILRIASDLNFPSTILGPLDIIITILAIVFLITVELMIFFSPIRFPKWVVKALEEFNA